MPAWTGNCVHASLKPAVYDAGPLNDLLGPLDPWAAAYLARMIHRGEGTSQDGSLACAIFSVAWRDQIGRAGGMNSREKMIRMVGTDPCQAVLPERQEKSLR